MEGMPEQIANGLGLFKPQQTVIHEHASELIADRFMDQDRRDRGIDAAGEAADHPALAYLIADFLDRFLAKRAHGPVTVQACDLAAKIAYHLVTVGRVP